MIDYSIFFSAVRKSLFQTGLTKGQVDGMEKIIGYWEEYFPHMSVDEMAYVLATIYHETGRVMRPVKEGGSQQYLRSKKYYPYIGVGLVQVTWAANWKRWGITSVDSGLSWPIALRSCFEGMVLGAFTGKKLADYIGKNRRDYFGARRIINGTDKADQIAKYADLFRHALNLAQAENPIVPPRPDVASADFIEMLKLALQDETIRQEIIAIVFPDEPDVAEADPMDEPHEEYGTQSELAFADADYDRDDRYGQA